MPFAQDSLTLDYCMAAASVTIRRRRSTRRGREPEARDIDAALPSEATARLRALKTSLALTVAGAAPRRRLQLAGAFAHRAVEAYWTAIQDPAEPRWEIARSPMRSQLRLPDDLLVLAEDLAATAATLDPPIAGFFMATAYAQTLPPGVRAALGAFYTPPALVARLLDQATSAGIDWVTGRVIDPACGGGAFLAPVAQRIVKEAPQTEPGLVVEILGQRLRGLEIDPIAAWMAQVFVEATTLPLCRAAGRRLPQLVEVSDSVSRRDLEAQYDLVIGNPPYGRITLPPTLRARYARVLYGHANLYGLFIDIALRLARDGGIVAYVTPTSFLAGQYYKNLRRILARDAAPVSIDFVADRSGVFDGVLQETVLATYRKDRIHRVASVNFLTHFDESSLAVATGGSFTVPLADEPWLVPRTLEQQRLIARLRAMQGRLTDWGYTVSTGPLVWNRHKSQLRARKGVGCRPLIWAEAVANDGRFVFRALRRNHKPYFLVRGLRDRWLVVRESCVLLQRTTAKEQRRRLVAAELPEPFVKRHGGVVIENHLNMVRRCRDVVSVEPHVLTAFLNSTAADAAFRCINGSVAVSAYELECLPLPEAAELSPLRALLAGNAPRTEIEKECWKLYGVEGPIDA